MRRSPPRPGWPPWPGRWSAAPSRNRTRWPRRPASAPDRRTDRRRGRPSRGPARGEHARGADDQSAQERGHHMAFDASLPPIELGEVRYCIALLLMSIPRPSLPKTTAIRVFSRTKKANFGATLCRVSRRGVLPRGAGVGAAGGVERLGQPPEVGRVAFGSAQGSTARSSKRTPITSRTADGVARPGGPTVRRRVAGLPGEQRRHLGGERAVAPFDVPALVGAAPPGQVPA